MGVIKGQDLKLNKNFSNFMLDAYTVLRKKIIKVFDEWRVDTFIWSK